MMANNAEWILVVALLLGCSQERPERKELLQEIDRIAVSAQSGKERFESVGHLNGLLASLRECKDRRLQVEVAREFATRIESNCPFLDKHDYSSYVVAVRRFGLNVGYLVTMLEEVDDDSAFRASLYNRLWSLYKKLCFAIPWTARAADESKREFGERLNAASSLLEEYSNDARSWKRFVFPKVRKELMPDLRDAFDKNCIALLTFPDRDDFRRSAIMNASTTVQKE